MQMLRSGIERVVKFCTIFSYECVFQKNINRNFQSFTKLAGSTAQIFSWLIIYVFGFLIPAGFYPDRKQMTADRFFPGNLSIIICLLYSAFYNSVAISNAVYANLTLDCGSYPSKLFIIQVHALSAKRSFTFIIE